MDNTSNVSATLIAGICGVLVGWLIWGYSKPQPSMQSVNGNAHVMPDGSVMGGNDMTSMMASMNAGLQGKEGDTFDREFLSEMIVHHQGAINMAKLALTNAKHQEIKDLANDIITAQTSEITQMKTWLDNWYGIK